MADSLTDGGWGKDSYDDPVLPAAEPNNPGRQDNKPPSSRFAGPSSQPKYGFEAFMDHRLNSSGSQMRARAGQSPAYDKGEFHGMTPGQAQENLRAEYAKMPDAQRQNWENTANATDIRSNREGQPAQPDASTAVAQTPSAPLPPYTANGANPVTPDASASVAATTPPTTSGRLGAVTGDTPAPAGTPTPVAAAPAPAAPLAAPFTQPGGSVVAYPGAQDNTDRFGPKLSGGGAAPVTSTVNPTPSLVPAGGLASSLPTDEGQKGPVSLPAPMPSSGGGTAPSDPSNFAGGKMPNANPPAMAGAAGEDIDPVTGKKRVSAMA